MGAGKRKLPSPEGLVRQAAPPQPLTGGERPAEEEEVVEQQLSRGRGARTAQSLENYVLQEKQEHRGHLREDGQKNRDTARGKKN